MITGFDGKTDPPDRHEDAKLCREAIEQVERHAAARRRMAEHAMERRAFNQRLLDTFEATPPDLAAEQRKKGLSL